MAYRYDHDLEFLGKLSSDELNDLVYTLTHDKDGKARFTEYLTLNEKYKRHYPNHTMYWKEIIEELQHFGGNSLANIFKGHGVLYREILCDVCKKMKVKYNGRASTKEIEQELVLKVLHVALQKMSPSELQSFADELGIENANQLNAEKAYVAFTAIFKYGGFKSYKLVIGVVNAIMKALTGKGLTIFANAAIARYLSIFTGPIGIAITSAITIIDLAGPAFRVTIPAVFQVIYLRTLYENRKAIAEQDNIDNPSISIDEMNNELNKSLEELKAEFKQFENIKSELDAAVAEFNAISIEKRQLAAKIFDTLSDEDKEKLIAEALNKLDDKQTS